MLFWPLKSFICINKQCLSLIDLMTVLTIRTILVPMSAIYLPTNNNLFRFLDARWLCQVGRNRSVWRRQKWGQSRTESCYSLYWWNYRNVTKSVPKGNADISNCQIWNKLYSLEFDPFRIQIVSTILLWRLALGNYDLQADQNWKYYLSQVWWLSFSQVRLATNTWNTCEDTACSSVLGEARVRVVQCNNYKLSYQQKFNLAPKLFLRSLTQYFDPPVD